MNSSTPLTLSANSGSSSLKLSLYQQSDGPQLILTSTISSITAPPAKFTFKVEKQDSAVNRKDEEVSQVTDHASAFAHFLDSCRAAQIDTSRITHICHRVVHGGDYSDPVVMNEDTYKHIEKLSDLAPLHNGAALSVIKSCINDLPKAVSIAFFDTAFHRSIPPHIANYAIDQHIAHRRGLKKYGFHGLSYSFILRSVAQYLKTDPNTLNLILLHLGSGASACAIRNGHSLDTSMGLTPLDGLPGATRSGAVDPSLIFHYTNKAGRITHDPKHAANLHVTQAEQILNSKSGWKAITGTTDFGVITKHAFDENADKEERDKCLLAFHIFADRILNFIGSYHLKLGGEVTALVFAGGIGERSTQLRSFITERIQCLGYPGIDEDKNSQAGSSEDVVTDISKPGNGPKILVCKTDEQFEMALQCANNPNF